MNNPLMNSSKVKYIETNNSYKDISTNDKLVEIKLNVDSIKNTMQDNMGKIIDRAENIENIGKKAELLNDHSGKYLDETRRFKRKMCIEKYKTNIIIFLFVSAILAIIVCLIYYLSKI